MMFYKIIITIFLTHVIISSGYTQEVKKINVEFTNTPFKEFVSEIESKTKFYFYYEENLLDSIRVTISAKEISLPDLLSKIFENTFFRFAIDGENQVYITKNEIIETKLHPDFFKRNLQPIKEEIIENELIDSDKTKLIAVDNRLYTIGSSNNLSNKATATIAGYIKEVKTGEPIVGAAVYIERPSIGVATDQYGYYSISLPKGRHTLKVSGIGMKDVSRQIQLLSDGTFTILMEEFIPSLKSVVVVSEKHSNVLKPEMGVERLSIKTLKQVPVIFGETDVLRVILSLPGVTSVGEASTGYNVRGGSADQNLILFNDATIYNPSHFFGFFSAFNPDIIKGVELYKSGIPEKYGGRLSSVLDVTTRDGNTQKISGNAGIGLLTSKLTLEGPLVKNKSSFIIAGRTTYSNWLLKKIPNEAYKNSEAHFQDANLILNHSIGNNDKIYFTGYISNDGFKLKNDTSYAYGNKNMNLKWKHNFSTRLHSIVTTGIDHYNYSITTEKNKLTAYKMDFSVNQLHGRIDFNYAPNATHNFNFGLNSVYYKINPGSLRPNGGESLIVSNLLEPEQGLESAIYFGDRINISQKLSVSVGLRYSLFNYLGPRKVNSYFEDIPKTITSIRDSNYYKSGELINNYHGPEYRASARYLLNNNSSVKISYNSLRQYLHMLSNTTAISPTDIWKLSDPNIKPQDGYQVSAGYYRNFKLNTIETSIELFYKQMNNYLDFKSGAKLLLNHYIETEVINTKGQSYGVEFLIKKTTGKLNGWVSYTFSRSFLKMDDPIAGELINEGNYYPANFDKPHNLNIITNYRFSHRLSVSLNVIYNTGRPITLPLSVFNLGGAPRLFYSERNQYRIPDYFRTDFSCNIESNHRIKQKTHNSWSFGIYNITGRENAYSVYFLQQQGAIKGYKLSIFGTLIPFITYNIRF
jgi:hypothetical protein